MVVAVDVLLTSIDTEISCKWPTSSDIEKGIYQIGIHNIMKKFRM